MKTVNPITTILYTTDIGKQPFADWEKKLSFQIALIVAKRLARVRGGNFGDCKPIKGYTGLYEIIIDFGPGYRILRIEHDKESEKNL